MKRILITSLLALIFTACHKEKSQIDIQINELDINPTEFKNIDTLKYDKGNIESLTFHKSANEYYKIVFYESGLKKQFYRIKNDQFHGKAIDWYENGNKKWTREYEEGNLIGHNITFQENGFREQDYNTEDNSVTYFFENGNPRLIYTDFSTTYYYDNGNKFEVYIYELNSKNENTGRGKVKFYSENKDLVFDGTYDKTSFSKDGNKFNGEITSYFNNGKPSLNFDLKDGITQGKYFTYHGNGNLKHEGETIDAKQIYHKSYYPNGKPEYEFDKINNIERHWDENGKPIE